MKTKARLVIYENGQLLMLKSARKHNRYCFVGGGVGKWESPVEALIRECEEEISLTVSADEIVLAEILPFYSHGKEGREWFYRLVSPLTQVSLIETWKFSSLDWLSVYEALHMVNPSGKNHLYNQFLNPRELVVSVL